LGPLARDSPCIIIFTNVLKLPTVFGTVTCYTGL
jgi:hypothetical protein